MIVAITDSLSDRVSSDDGEDGEDEDDDGMELGKLSKDDEPGWVMGTLTKTVLQSMQSFREKQMKLHKLTQPRWVDAANYFRQRDKKYGASELRVPAIVQPQTEDDAAAPAPTTFGELMECLEIVPGIWQMPQWASQPASSHIRLHLVNAQSNSSIPSLEPAAECNKSLLLKAKPVEPVTFYPCRMPPPDHHIDFGFVQRHGDRTCLSRGIDKESVILHVIWWRKSSCLPMLLLVRFFLSSVTKLSDMIIRL